MSLHSFSCKDVYIEEMPFLEQVVAMSGSFGDGQHFMSCMDSENSNGELHPYLGSWSLELEKQTNLDSDLGDVMLNPRTMAPVNVEESKPQILPNVIEIKPVCDVLEDLPEVKEEMSIDDLLMSEVARQPNAFAGGIATETNAVLEQPWNREVVLIQISPTSKSNGGALKIKNSENTKTVTTQTKQTVVRDERYEKPPFSYSCLIALALKNSESGFLPVSEIYSFILDNFPFFRTAPDGWKNSIRHNLSLNKCFQKLETPSLNGTTRKACLWGLNEDKIARLDEDILKWTRRTPDSKQALYGSRVEFQDKPGNGDMGISEEVRLPVIVPSSARPTWVSSATDLTDVKLYKIVKVTQENSQPLCKVPDITIKQEVEAGQEPEPLVLSQIPVLEDCRDPMVGGLTVLNGLYDDLTETGELREAAQSFSIAQSSLQSVCRHSNESSVIRKTVVGFA